MQQGVKEESQTNKNRGGTNDLKQSEERAPGIERHPKHLGNGLASKRDQDEANDDPPALEHDPNLQAGPGALGRDDQPKDQVQEDEEAHQRAIGDPQSSSLSCDQLAHRQGRGQQ